MQTVLEQMFDSYNTVSLEDKKNTFKEVVQEVVYVD